MGYVAVGAVPVLALTRWLADWGNSYSGLSHNRVDVGWSSTNSSGYVRSCGERPPTA